MTLSPDLDRLEQIAWPMGKPEPPSAEDVAAAEKFVDQEFADRCPIWLANHRVDLVRDAAQAFQHKRQDREFHEALAVSARCDRRAQAALAKLPRIRAELKAISTGARRTG